MCEVSEFIFYKCIMLKRISIYGKPMQMEMKIQTVHITHTHTLIHKNVTKTHFRYGLAASLFLSFACFLYYLCTYSLWVCGTPVPHTCLYRIHVPHLNSTRTHSIMLQWLACISTIACHIPKSIRGFIYVYTIFQMHCLFCVNA